MSVTEQLSLDYARTGVSVGMHPMRIARKSLGRNILSSSQLLNVKKGKKVQVAGMVICRQRPMTASGVVFMTLEDEFGFINLVLWQRTFQKLRRVATTESMLIVSGKVDRVERVDTAESQANQAGVLALASRAPSGDSRAEGEAASSTIHVIVSDLAPLRVRSEPQNPRTLSHVPATVIPAMSRDFH